MAEQKIKVPRAADKVLFECFCEIARKYNVSQISGGALGSVRLGNISVTSEPEGLVKLLLSKNSAVIESLSFSIETFNVAFYRGGYCGQNEKSAIYDEVVFNHNDSNPTKFSEEDRIEVVSFISQKLKAFDPKRQVTKVSEEQAQLEAIHISTLERLEQLNEELIRKSSEFREKNEETYRQKEAILEAQTEKKREELAAEHAQKVEEVSKTKEELDLRLKEVDDRDNTHVRRELRKDLQTEIKSRQASFKLTQDTNNLRLPIHLLCIAIIAFLFTFTFIYGEDLLDILKRSKEITIPTTILIIMALKSVGVTGGAIGFAIFYLKWMNRWLEQHTQAEFQLKQFQLDVDRASWAVETALAWKNEVKDVIPTTLLESITKNLFQHDVKPSETALHPADQLASALLGTASKVRLKAGDSEIELDAKKLKKVNDKKD